MKRIVIATTALLALHDNGHSKHHRYGLLAGLRTAYTDGVELSLQGSLQAVKLLSVDETTVRYHNFALGAGGTKQVDGFLAVNESVHSSLATSRKQLRGV